MGVDLSVCRVIIDVYKCRCFERTALDAVYESFNNGISECHSSFPSVITVAILFIQLLLQTDSVEMDFLCTSVHSNVPCFTTPFFRLDFLPILFIMHAIRMIIEITYCLELDILWSLIVDTAELAIILANI